MILAHHGGEALLLQAVLAGAGSLSVGLALFRAQLARLLRRRPGNRDRAARGPTGSAGRVFKLIRPGGE